MKRLFAALAALLLSLQLAVPAFADAAAPMDPGKLLADPTVDFWLCVAVAVILVVAVILLIRHRRKKKARNPETKADRAEDNTNTGGNTK